MKISVITVNYNDFLNTNKFVNSILSLSCNIKIYIYDNNSNQYYKEKLKEHIEKLNNKNIKLIESFENIGYFPAVRKVYDTFLNNKDFDFLVVSNNDIIIKDDHFFKKLSKYINKYHVIAPRIISLLTGKDQNPYRETSIKKFIKLHIKFILVMLLLALYAIILENY